MPTTSVTIFTDPACPFGFNAQRQEAQLAWHYGHGIDVTRRMIVLREEAASFESLGITREQVAGTSERLRSEYGMPMLVDAQDSFRSTRDACQAYVGARIHAPEQADLLLRALRRRMFSEGENLDDLEVIRGAGEEVGLSPEAIDAWLADEEVAAALNKDMKATRSPSPEACALPHRLSRSRGSLRYSTASAIFECGERRLVMAGFQPFAVYEVAMANVAPGLERRDAPESAEAVLEWATYPLATAEVAALRGISVEEARQELQQSGAVFQASAGDGYWSAPASG